MKMEKKMWSTPMATVEQFAANEYVNACWQVACLLPQRGENDPERGDLSDPWGGYHSSTSGTCGSTSSQYIYNTSEEDVYAMKEKNWLYQWMDVKFYIGNNGNGYDWDGNRPDKNDSSLWSSTITLTKDMLEDDTPDYIYWRTDGLTTSYYHYGLIDLTKENRSKHS